MTVGFFSPLPPAPSGVADYSAALLTHLRPLADVRMADPGADIRLYHLGNNALHREIYRQALARPGLIVLHDAVLHHFLLGSLEESAYVEEFVYNYGPWRASLARRLWAGRSRSATDPRYFAYPLLKRAVETALGVVVHNPGAAAMARAHVPEAHIFEIPHLHFGAGAPTQWDAARLRDSLNIPRGEFLFGVFGHLRESKRVATVLRAFARVREAVPCALLFAGEFVSSDLERAVAPLLHAPGIVRVGHTPETDFARHAAAAQACINLRHPSAGESSGITVRLMALGKPVLLTSCAENAGFPDAACVRIDSGPAEEDMLAAVMIWMARFPYDARAIGERAAAHIARYHDPAAAARAYAEALAACYHRDHR